MNKRISFSLSESQEYLSIFGPEVKSTYSDMGASEMSNPSTPGSSECLSLNFERYTYISSDSLNEGGPLFLVNENPRDNIPFDQEDSLRGEKRTLYLSLMLAGVIIFNSLYHFCIYTPCLKK